MKQRYPSMRFEVVRMREIPLPSITPTTRQTQVIGFGNTAPRPRDDVVYRLGIPVCSAGLRQYSQRFLARAVTNRRSFGGNPAT
jgi:hypothetical protein